MSPPEEAPQSDATPAPDPAPTPPPPTPDQEHEARLKADPKGRFCSMVDLMLRGCTPSEFEEACTAVRALAGKAQSRL